MKVLGLMTGTSMDGLDCSISDIYIDKHYNFSFKILDYKTFNFDDELKEMICLSIGNKNSEVVNICHDNLGLFFLEKVKLFLVDKKVDLISIHGQTISHIDKLKSIQIGNPKYLYNYFTVPVYYNFRSKDIALGGCGAPLIPFLDWLLFKKFNYDIITLNIGGISNISYIPKYANRSEVVGFDTGPGMCLIDELVKKEFNLGFDKGGLLSKKGVTDKNLLNYMLKDKFVNKEFPKSTSREYFGYDYLKNILATFPLINKYDILRTLVSFTVESIILNIIKNRLDLNKYKLILSGGGIKNITLFNEIIDRIGESKIITSSCLNINADTKESFLMAVLGICRHKNINNNMPSVTGAKYEACYGELYE
ncbi:anhydro-N-acetylmuramic acid kinase [Candidatus Marinimicrobia bacterium]|nr:anhydro-N-acetylmuramic acid kinase [Candidatus Neomarinimicrobiota bacterium]